MPTPFLLDTNAYARFFRNPKSDTPEKAEALHRMMQKIESGSIKSFYISEITSMEIHSVLGKFRRGQKQPPQRCEREIVINGARAKCDHWWFSRDNEKMSREKFHDMQKRIADIERQAGDVQATILALDSHCIEEAKKLLRQYADRYNFGSQDALIVGSLIAKKQEGLNLTLITSDNGFKNVLKAEGIDFYDPLNV